MTNQNRDNDDTATKINLKTITGMTPVRAASDAPQRRRPLPRIIDQDGWIRGTITRAIGVWKVGLIAAAVAAAGCIGAHNLTIASVTPHPKRFCLLQCMFGLGLSRARLMEMRRVAPPVQ